jgi:voltage-gated potassium channel
MRRGLARRKRRRGLDPHRRLYAGITGLFLVIIIGTVGFIGFGLGFLDALFQTVITVSTVGFGEAKPFNNGEKVFTIFLILVGVAVAAYTFGVAIDTFVEGYLGGTYRRRRMEREINSMHGHVILCGWGRVGQAIARHLLSSKAEIVVVDASTDRLASVDMPYVHGDATDEAVLRAAGISRARVLVTALNTDADNLYVTLTARSMASRLFIVSRAATESAVDKLVYAGANRVVNPQDLGGARMAAFAVQPHVAEFLDVVMHDGSLQFRLEEVEVPVGSPLAGETLRSARVHDRTGTLVLAMRHPDRAFRTNPPPTAEIVGGEVLIVIGDAEQVGALRLLALGDGE